MEAAEGIEPDGLCTELHTALPRPEVEDPIHVCGRHICCIHGWAEAIDPTADRPSHRHLGTGPDDGCQGGSLFVMRGKGIRCKEQCWEGWTWWWEVCWAKRETREY